MRISPLITDKKTYPFVFSFNDNYAKYFSVTLLSLIAHKDEDCIYDIIVLHDDISDETINALESMIPNQVFLRFYNVTALVQNTFGTLAASLSSRRWVVSTFYDLLVPIIMPDYERVLYCDSDLLFCENPAELFSVSFVCNLLIASKDTLSLSAIVFSGDPDIRKQIAFVQKTIGIRHLEEYFNAGVLLFNTAAIDGKTYIKRIQHAFSFPTLPTVDQDVLNYVFLGRVKLLSPRYNLQMYMLDRLLNHERTDPESVEFLQEAAHPVIIHFSTGEKPWKTRCPMDEQFWRYAKTSPFFETILLDFGGFRFQKEVSPFSIRRYLISRVLSKVTFGEKRRRYETEYKNQRKLYDKIRYGY